MNNHYFHKCKAYSRIENDNLQLSLHLNKGMSSKAVQADIFLLLPSLLLKIIK